MQINHPNFDKCRFWIKDARKNNCQWEEIKFGKGTNEDELILFLNHQIEMNFWPDNIDASTWYELVESEKDGEERSRRIKLNDESAILVDSNSDSEVKVPEDQKSSWQLYKNHIIESGFNEESVAEIESATLGILKRLNIDTSNSEPIKGLVIGYVQSGKTANMAALMAMAADYGWNFFIVLSGTIENLRKQTQNRLFRDLNKPGNINWIGLEHLSRNSPPGNRAQDLRLEGDSNLRYFTVCLKNSGRLKGLIEWMQRTESKYRQMKVILIDDEADQASINTADISKNERAKINKLIVNLVEGKTVKGEDYSSKIRSMNYISYTATPYANFLSEATPESLYPRNFIKALGVSNEYFGPKQIFGIDETENSDGMNVLRLIQDEDLVNLKKLHDDANVDIPESLKDSICWLLCASASMRIQNYAKPISMLVHTSQKQAHHSNVAEGIRKWIIGIDKISLIDRCRMLWEYETQALDKTMFRQSFEDYGKSDDEINDYPKFDEIKDGLCDIAHNVTNIQLGEDGELTYTKHIHLCIDNCANNGVNEDGMFVRLAYPDPKSENYPSPAPVFIVVGGSTLSRGLTIEGLVSTYFLRASCQADSLMQMGRWFGYRRGYELFPRLWMSSETYEKFKFLAVLESELRQDLRRFSDAGADPSEFGPRVRNIPDTINMKVTAKNKMRGAAMIEMDYAGISSQTILFDDDKLIQLKNIDVAERFIERIGNGILLGSNTSYVFENVDFEVIENELFRKFTFQTRTRVFNQMDTLCDWVNTVTSDGRIGNWNVIVAGTAITEPDDDKIWEVSNIRIGKVTRTRKILDNLTDKIIDIGVLRAPKDLVADIRFDLLKEIDFNISNPSVAEIMNVRRSAGLEKIPQLIIYRIDKNSQLREGYIQPKNSHARAPLNSEEDLIGICILLPGAPSKNIKAGALTIKIDSRKLNLDEVEGE